MQPIFMVLAFNFASTRRPWDTYVARRMKCNFQAVAGTPRRENFQLYLTEWLNLYPFLSSSTQSMVVLLLNQPSYVNGRINAHYIQQIISFVLRSYSIWFNNNSITMYCVYRWKYLIVRAVLHNFTLAVVLFCLPFHITANEPLFSPWSFLF